MKSLLALILGTLLGSFAASAAQSGGDDLKASPRIEFGSTNFDFGRITAGEPATHSFIFTNTGSATLEITDVKPGCGCTTAGEWDRSVPPGKTGAIPLQFNSSGFGGAVAKTAAVICNDPRQSNVVLQLSGTVWKPIELTPSVVVFQPTEEERAKQTKSVRIVSNLDEPLTLSDLECTDPSFKAELNVVKPGKNFQLQVTALPPFTNRYSGGAITMKTSSKQAPLLSITVSMVVQLELTVIPRQLTIAPGPLAGSLTSFVTIVNNSKREVTFSEPGANAAEVGVKMRQLNDEGNLGDASTGPKRVPPGKQVILAVEFPAGFEAKEKLELTLKTTHPKYPVLTIPISKM